VLGGVQVINGFVIARTAALTKTEHGVVIQVASATTDIVVSSAKPKEYKNSSFQTIANDLLRPFQNVNLVTKNLDQNAQKAFGKFSPQLGETVFEALERLGRMRGIMFVDDEQGNLVAFQANQSGAPSAELEEGRNILAIRGTFTDKNVMQKVYAVGQTKGSDNSFAGSVAKTAAVATNSNARAGRELILIAEHPADSTDLQTRADHEVARQQFTSVDVNVLVHGWFKSSGSDLWKPTENSSVVSPTVIPTADGKIQLAIRQVTFVQDRAGGTRTSLDLCLPSALTPLPDITNKGAVPNLLEKTAATFDFDMQGT
jgi:prophage tail gpP-like protein